MKIADWENLLKVNYSFIKDTNVSKLRNYMIENKNGKLIGFLKLGDIFIYLESNDFIHLTGRLSNKTKEITGLTSAFIKSNLPTEQIKLVDYIDFFVNKGFEFVDETNMSEQDLKFYEKNHEIDLSKICENQINNKAFFAFYVFDDAQIASENTNTVCVSEYSNTIIILSSENKQEIDNLYLIKRCNISSKDYEIFMDKIAFNEAKSNLKNKLR